MKKALIVTTVSGFVPQFEMNNVKILQSMGYEVHYAANYNMPVYSGNNHRLDGTGIIRHHFNFLRSPFSIRNIAVYKEFKLFMEKEKFDLVHCHTPMGGVMARLAAKKTKTSPIVYTAHGFHFFRGAPIINWLVFFPIEYWLAKYTDVLITINKEDYIRASKFRIRNQGSVEYVPGVGLCLDRYDLQLDDSALIRQELGINKDDFLIVSIGELTKRKNHKAVLETLALIKSSSPNIKYIICGSGALEEELKVTIKKLGLLDFVILAGYRNDIAQILHASDCFVFPSLQEGLPVALMEAMASGLPVICSKIRGNVDLIEEGVGGFLIENQNRKLYADRILKLKSDKELRLKMGQYNKRKIKEFEIDNIEKRMIRIYERLDKG